MSQGGGGEIVFFLFILMHFAETSRSTDHLRFGGVVPDVYEGQGIDNINEYANQNRFEEILAAF